MEIGYNLSAKLVERLGISSFRVYASGMNLVTWSKLKMYDPESTNTLGHYYPQARLINTGILLSF